MTMGKKRVLGKKNALSNGTVVAFACNCVGGPMSRFSTS